MVNFVAINKGYDISILFDSTGFTEICKLGPLVVPFLHLAVELGEGHYRHIKFFGQGLERAGNLRYLLLPPLASMSSPHQLQVVHNNESHVLIPLQATRFGPKLQCRDCWSVVYKNGCLADCSSCPGETWPVAFAQKSTAHLLGIHPGFRAKQPHTQLRLVHLQRKDTHRYIGFNSSVAGNVEGKGGLSHTGAASNNDQIGGLQTRGKPVQLCKTGGNTGYHLPAVIELLEGLDALLDDLFDGEK